MKEEKIISLYNSIKAIEKSLNLTVKYLEDENFRRKAEFWAKIVSGIFSEYSLPLFIIGFRIGRFLKRR